MPDSDKKRNVAEKSLNKRSVDLDATNFVKILVWPFVFLVVALSAIYLGRRDVAVKMIQLSPKGLEISFNLLKAVQSDTPEGVHPTTTPNVSAIQEQAEKASKISLNDATILWVDDHPENNDYERKALEVLGIRFTTATSTSQALEFMSHQRFSLVISDFAREDDAQAGYTLLRKVRDQGRPVPFIIFSSAADQGFNEDAKKLGAVGQTNDPQVLFDMVLEVIRGRNSL